MATMHLTLQAKGGVGKSYVASILAQYLTEAGCAVRCIDTDTTNPTLLKYEPLAAEYLQLSHDHVIDPRALDRLVETVTGAAPETHFVVDVGSNGFETLMAYAVENALFELLAELGSRVVIHAVVAGGPDAAETLRGTRAVLEASEVSALVWLNAHLGPLEHNGKPIEALELWASYAERLLGMVTLRAQTAATFGRDVEEMLRRRLTFDEAIAAFDLMPRTRIKRVKQDLWAQLDGVFEAEPAGREAHG
jgi:hypothetical protein